VIFKKGFEMLGLSLCGSEYAPVDGRFEHGDELAGSSFIGMFLANTQTSFKAKGTVGPSIFA
jgi:hypothetical protein